MRDGMGALGLLALMAPGLLRGALDSGQIGRADDGDGEADPADPTDPVDPA